MALRYPAGADDLFKKWAFCLRLKERARLMHNLMGLWTRVGLTADQYANGVDSGLLEADAGVTVTLSQKIKDHYGYIAQLSKDAFSEWQGGPFRLYWQEAAAEMNRIQTAVLKMTTWDGDVDLDDVDKP